MITVVIVTGERDWRDKQQILDTLDQLLREHIRAWCGEVPNGKPDLAAARKDFVLRHGVSGNTDIAADDWGKDRGVTIERFPADWNTPAGYNPAAGPIRNRDMAAKDPRADLCLAFWSGQMRKRGNREYSGTLDMIKQALQHWIQVRIVPPSTGAAP